MCVFLYVLVFYLLLPFICYVTQIFLQDYFMRYSGTDDMTQRWCSHWRCNDNLIIQNIWNNPGSLQYAEGRTQLNPVPALCQVHVCGGVVRGRLPAVASQRRQGAGGGSGDGRVHWTFWELVLFLFFLFFWSFFNHSSSSCDSSQKHKTVIHCDSFWTIVF